MKAATSRKSRWTPLAPKPRRRKCWSFSIRCTRRSRKRPAPETPVFLAPDVNPALNNDSQAPQSGAALTTADKLREQYQKIGDAQKHVFGEGGPGTLPPNFNLKVPGVNAPAAPAGATGATGATGLAAKPHPKPAPPVAPQP